MLYILQGCYGTSCYLIEWTPQEKNKNTLSSLLSSFKISKMYTTVQIFGFADINTNVKLLTTLYLFGLFYLWHNVSTFSDLLNICTTTFIFHSSAIVCSDYWPYPHDLLCCISSSWSSVHDSFFVLYYNSSVQNNVLGLHIWPVFVQSFI